MRLVNMHTAPLDTARPNTERVKPGDVGDFNEANPSVRQWIDLGMLVSEDAVLASRAAALGNAPSVAEMLALRELLAQRDAALEDAHARIAARDASHAASEKRFGELNGELAVAREQLAAAKARIAELEELLELHTAPASASGPVASEPAATALENQPARATRTG